MNIDHRIYFKLFEDMKIILILYIDDFLILYNNLEIIQKIKEKFNEEFEITDLGETKYIFEIHLKQNLKKRFIRIYQNEYIMKLFEKFEMEDCKFVIIPLDISVKL